VTGKKQKQKEEEERKKKAGLFLAITALK